MTQTITGSGLGLNESSINLGNYGAKGSSALGQGNESVYVNAANGNLILRQADGFLADMGIGLELFQTYNSYGESGGSWCFNVQSCLEFHGNLNQPGSFITRIDEDGHHSCFIWDAKTQAYRSEKGGVASLVYSGHDWVYRKVSDNAAWHYDRNGQLAEIKDRDGHYFSFTYQNGQLATIESSHGKQKITWSFAKGLLQEVKTLSEEKIVHYLRYEYDECQRLHRVSCDLDGRKRYWITYDYVGDSNRVSDIQQADGTKLHIDYDAQGRVKQLVDGEGRVISYEYSQGYTVFKNSIGEAWTYWYDEKNRLTGIDGPEAYQIRYHYEGLYLSRIIQGNQVWRYRYNEAGDCIYAEEPNGQIIKRTYDREHHLLRETSYQAFDGEHHPIAPQTNYSIYNTQGHLRFSIAADGTVTEYRYNEEGLLISTRCYLRVAYNVQNVADNDLLDEMQLNEWVVKQNPQQISLIDYQYDWRGQLQEEIHYSLIDAQGNGIDTQASHVRTRYDAAGRLREKSVLTTEGWTNTTYLYDDLGRLTQTTDNQGHVQKIEYDDQHQRIIQTDANGLQTIRTYDRSGLLLSIIRLDSTHEYGVISYEYDQAGRLISETGVDGLTTYYFYDAQGRLHSKINAQGQMIEYSYNDVGMLVQTHQYAQRINTQGWKEQRPAFATITPKTTKQDNISQTIYNQYQQIAYTVNSQGGVIGYTYDAQGRVLSKTAYATLLTTFSAEKLLTWDNINLERSGQDRCISYYYNQAGYLQAEINGEGYATEYAYNRLGQLIETCRYKNISSANLTGDWVRDRPAAQVRDIHTYSLYNAQGLKVADIDGERFLIEYLYDDRGFLQKKVAYAKAVAKNIAIQEDTNLDLLRPLKNTNDHYTIYRYDDLGQLLEEKNQSGLVTTYAYDEMGQLTLVSRYDGKSAVLRQQRSRYDALGRLIQQLDELGCAKLNAATNLSEEQIESIWQNHSMRYTYDKSGILLSKTNALQQTTRYFYNAHRQLQYTVDANGAVMETRYNALNQVKSVRKYSSFLKNTLQELNTQTLKQQLEHLKNEHFDEITIYEYNSIGQLIAKQNGSRGLITSEYNSFGDLILSTTRINTQHQSITQYTYDRRGLLLKQIEDYGNINRKIELDYDAFGWLKTRTDGEHHQFSYTMNKRGEQIIITNPRNRSNDISYDAFGRVLTESKFSSLDITRYTYDDQGNTFIVENLLTHTRITTQLNAFGDKISVIDANSKKTQFEYDERGLLNKTFSPEKTFKQYDYDAAGRVICEEDAGGRKIVYTYDPQGHVLTKTIDPDNLNLRTQYQYDAIGRQLRVTEANGCIKQFTYNDQGHLIKSCIDPDGLNLVTELTYDDRGLLLRQIELNPKGKNKVTAYEWDSLGRRTATIIDPDGLALTTCYEYDANDNLVCQTDANQHSTHYVYNALNQCRYQIDPRGVITEHIYDFQGCEETTITYANRIDNLSEYTETNIQQIIIKDEKHDQYLFRRFDPAGRLTHSCDALGYMTVYTYDGNNNIIKKTLCQKAISLDVLKKGNMPFYPDETDARITYYVYDGLNQLRLEYDRYLALTELRYDQSGQLIQRIQYGHAIDITGTKTPLEYLQNYVTLDPLHDKITRYYYDKAGRLSLEISPQRIAKSYQYNGLNQLISCTRYASVVPFELLAEVSLANLPQSAHDRTNYFIYDLAGREAYRISAEGHIVERCYDAVGNVTKQITHSQRVASQNYQFQDLAEVLQKDSETRMSRYDYDAAGRLLNETNAEKQVIAYEYDANGNVRSKIAANQAVWTYQYDENNQLIETISPQVKINNQKRSIVTRCEYDSFGNLIKETRDAADGGIQQTRVYEYDANKRRIKTIYPNVAVNQAEKKASMARQESIQNLTEEWRYSAFGELIASKDKAGNWQHFAYNNQGQLVFQVNTKGGLVEYRYDFFGRLLTKKMFYTPLTENDDYTLVAIMRAARGSDYDRHEYYAYDLDDRLVETSRDKIRTYDAVTSEYSKLKPITQKIYNAFGEVIQTKTKLTETAWATTTFYYDNDGHQTATIDAENYLTTYTFGAFGEMQSMTEHASAIAVDLWDINDYTVPQAHAKDRTVTFTYDALGQMTSKTLKKVAVSRLENHKLITETRDLITTYSYDALGHLTQTVDAKGNSAYFYYDALGQLITKISPKNQDGRAATTYSYDALGNLVETHRWAKGAQDFIDSEHYRLTQSADDIITTSQFDAQGLLLSETDGKQHTINYSYDANGNLVRSFQTLSVSGKGSLVVDKRYTYDSENHLLQTATFKNDGVTLHTEDATYNIFGEVIAKGFGGRYNLHVDYDLLGRVWRSNSQGFYQIFVYDLTDKVTQIVTAANGFDPSYGDEGIDLSGHSFEDAYGFNGDNWRTQLQRQNNVYNALGHLLTQTKEYSSRIWQDNKEILTVATQSQAVDRWGNMLSYTNTLGYQTFYEYNAFNEVTRQELPQVSYMDEHGARQTIKPVNHYAYDELGQAIALIDANGHMMSKAYDAAGRIISETDAKNNSRSKHYNLLDQLTSSTSEHGAKTTYLYDKTNRLVSVTTPQTHQEYTYDEVGNIIQQKNGVGETISFEYNTLGQQFRRHDARGFDSYYGYDDAGRKIRQVDANIGVQTWKYDENGHLEKHTDIGGNTTSYEYNRNGLVIHETSTHGKNITYYYRGDGQLKQYADTTRNEVIEYTYDTEGQLLSKCSSGGYKGDGYNGWIRESDYYEYDSQGRLTRMRRRNPDDTDSRFPAEDKAILSVDYDYDQAGNIRHTQVSAKYPTHAVSRAENYYTYDENNRMVINKGQLINGTIQITGAQGSELIYDAAGNIANAIKYENGVKQNYHYDYNLDNQLVLIQKNGKKIQSKAYDAAGRVNIESVFDALGNLAQRSILTYTQGLVESQRILNGNNIEVSLSNYSYDNVGNLRQLTIKTKTGTTTTHAYTYEFWDTYQQKEETVTIVSGAGSTSSKSVRYYDVNGLLQDSIDYTPNTTYPNSIHYLNSSLDGLRSRFDKNGCTNYLSVNGKVIGDLRLENTGKQSLTVYSGFTPAGSQTQAQSGGLNLFYSSAQQQKVASLFQREAGDMADGTLPEIPQDTVGTYTLQAGDDLESIALQVYGDSSLWYLIADANGITNRKASAGNAGELQIGQRLTIPPTASGQHHTQSTHKVLDANRMIGEASPNTPLPTPVPAKPKPHNNFLGKVITAIVAVIATVMTAGVLGIAAGATGSLFSAGLSVLGGGLSSLTNTAAIGLTAGFVGSIASQGVANAFGLQEGIDYKSALITGLATAATAGIGYAFNGTTFKPLQDSLNKGMLGQQFNIASAAEIMEQNAASQSLNIALRKHQHFDWTELGISGLTGGLLGGKLGRKVDESLEKLDHQTGLLRSEFQALVGAGAQSAASGAHFDATQVLADNLGSAVGNAVVANALSRNENVMETLSIDELMNDWKGYSEGFNDYLESQVDIQQSTSERASAIQQSSKPKSAELISMKQLRKMFPQAKQELLEAYLPEFNTQLATAEINTPKRLAFFFATVNVETAGMTRMIENNFTYKDPQRAYNLFKKLRKDTLPHIKMTHAENLQYIKQLGQGECFANIVYGDLYGNGNPASGDGYRYRGRGLFHFTFKDNYEYLGGKNFIENPDLILIPSNDIKAAVKYWKSHELYKKVDLLHSRILSSRGEIKDDYFIKAVETINPGMENIIGRAISYNQYVKIFSNRS